jgi:hypothetical protein
MRRLLLACSVGLLALCACAGSASTASAVVPPEFEKYGLALVSASLSDTQAGAHPDFTASFELSESQGQPYALSREVVVGLPPGLFGDPQAFPKCTPEEFGSKPAESHCPIDSQVGTMQIHLGGVIAGSYLEPVYIMPVPSHGDIVARLGFYALLYPATINVRLDPVTHGLFATGEGFPTGAPLLGSTTTLWGVPADPAHDHERFPPSDSKPHSSTLPDIPFMTNPTSCGQEREVTFAARSYQTPDSISRMSAPLPQITGCNLLEFNPSTSLMPTTTQGTSGTGLDYELGLPTTGLQFGNLTYGSELKRSEVILPQGMTINPSEAVGIGVCSEADFARETYDSGPNVGCPETSKIGSVTSDSPVIDKIAEGSLYLARSYENPFGSLLALYLTAKIPDRGVLVKLAGQIALDPNTGQITTTFDNLPQLPIGSFHLHFREGARAPLITPYACGAYHGLSNMSPWSAPASIVSKENTFRVESGPGHTPCPAGATPPFSPTVIAGTQSNAAGSYSPFYLRISRGDGEQEITRFSTVMPTGLTGNLTGIPFCPDSAVESARNKTGQQELAGPSCPAASEIGHSIVGAGVGDVLAQTPGKLYLAGPYHGAPLSLVSVTSATTGPFDLGTVVIRFGLKINPANAQVEVDSTGSDPIPHILQGIVVHVRDIRVYIDRPNFMINPTGCKPKSILNAVAGAGASIASRADDTSTTIASRFQAAECQALRFEPKFTAATSAKVSRKSGASLKVKLVVPRASQGTMANLAKVKVSLPRQLPSRLSTLQLACVDHVFEANPAACPVASRIGVATTTTPIVPVPLSGPVYFVSHGARAFPDLVIVLQGYGITVDLRGETHISKDGVTTTTFRTIPDVPVGTFEMTLPQGPYSALASSSDLCKAARTSVLVTKRLKRSVNGRVRTVKAKVRKRTPGLAMATALVAQNGSEVHQSTPIAVSGCGKQAGGTG